ncbi:MAG: hypothetical protein AAFQ35_07325 [Pseudomonadota bacterium]
MANSIGASAIRAQLDEAQAKLDKQAAVPYDPPPGLPAVIAGEEVNPGEWRGAAGKLGLPRECPVIPLGINSDTMYYLDTVGQLIALEPPYSKGHILALFKGRPNYLYWAWPGFDKEGNLTRWRAERAQEDLLAAATRCGMWNAADKVRGLGCWRTPDGRLVWHLGDELLIGGVSEPPGVIDGFVYPTRPTIPGPWPQPAEGEKSPASLLLTLLRSWQWERPEVDPVLMLGWIGVAFLGAALDWRPMVFVTGDKASGKSTLQDVVKALLGDWLIKSADTTAAGIYQRVGQDCVPVAVDEMESDNDPRRAVALVKLARIAASGDDMLRGGDSHKGTGFQARNAFLFSSINAPPLEPQDVSRMALLRLRPLSRDATAPEIDPGSLGIFGRLVMRRLADNWHAYAETRRQVDEALHAGGMDGRGKDTFGTLLAVAALILGTEAEDLDVPFGDDLSAWAELLDVRNMIEFENALPNWQLCLNHLLSVPVDVWRSGSRHTVGQWLEAFWDSDPRAPSDKDSVSFEELKRVLAQAGLGIVRDDDDPLNFWLLVPNLGPLIARLYEGTKWAGSLTSGGWSQALRQGDREEFWRTCNRNIAGVRSRATMISLMALYGPDGIMRDDRDHLREGAA